MHALFPTNMWITIIIFWCLFGIERVVAYDGCMGGTFKKQYYFLSLPPTPSPELCATYKEVQPSRLFNILLSSLLVVYKRCSVSLWTQEKPWILIHSILKLWLTIALEVVDSVEDPHESDGWPETCDDMHPQTELVRVVGDERVHDDRHHVPQDLTHNHCQHTCTNTLNTTRSFYAMLTLFF